MRIAKYILFAFLAITVQEECLGSELAILNFIPGELKRWFDPQEFEEEEHNGWVERGRRDLNNFENNEGLITYTVYGQGSGNPCIYAQTDCTFNINYRTPRSGIRVKTVFMPASPNITGSCVKKGDSSMISMLWSVYNFSLIFTKNPEGNSYYLNQATLVFTQIPDLFPGSDYNGVVVLQTKTGRNYYFTPLGKSYFCKRGRDQGPLKMYNTDDEVMGNMTLYNSRFQPFVKRAKGLWGEKVECLPKEIQVLREDIVPYAVSMVYLITSSCLIAGYGLYRYFRVKKQSYECYGVEDQEEYRQRERPVEGTELKAKGANRLIEEYDGGNMAERDEAETQALTSFNEPNDTPEQAPSTNNPFKANKSSNPFSN